MAVRTESQRAYYATHKVAILALQKAYHKKYLQTERGKQNKLENTYRMRAKYPEKYKARYTLRNAVKTGYVVKGACEICGIIKVESHHDDYSKPLEVRWLCHQHHCELEGRR